MNGFAIVSVVATLVAIVLLMHWLNLTEAGNPTTIKRTCPRCGRRLLWHGPFKLRQNLKLFVVPPLPHDNAGCRSRLLPVNEDGRIMVRYEKYQPDRQKKSRRHRE